ncbi:PREDICTED: FBD-associated F-box protein At5g56370-like [Camelina sativa]|uniref:FBD-associated F-box protein At5g56370-like n=1 Tax=Camelina sativa TaxID=90675 RepID=A0ABM1QJ14_CAMSA|nr:PREDICTED: FBD-associated F-box protein At5g56370-like [Camelina sativa]
MDRISLLPDECLLQILSSLTTKDVLKTSLLSKRWRNLWKLVPKLEYIYYDEDVNLDNGRLMRFVDRSLLLNEAPVLERLCFKFLGQCDDVDIGFWVRIAVERGLSDFEYLSPLFYNEPKSLPQSLFTCGTLVELKLTNVSLEDVKFPVSFPFLKTLHLSWVIYLDDESPKKFLSSCQILEVLVVDRHYAGDNVGSFSITVPSLQKLTYFNEYSSEGLFALNAPSLKSLEISDSDDECIIEKLPEIMAANLEVTYWNTDDILGSLTSVKRLSLCLPSKSQFPTGKIFHQLVSLEFCCTCDTKWDLLISLFKHSPKLRPLKLNERHGCSDSKEELYHLEGEPISVPENLIMLRLETLEWRNYRGWYSERELVTFILEQSRGLRRASFTPVATNLEKKSRMLKELADLFSDSTCQFLFG